jgi:uncharacterized membrane protein
MSVRKIVISGILAAVVIVLGVTRIGFIPTPTPAGNATIMHVPAIVGGILEGTVVGWLIGTIFGLFSFIDATVPMFKDPLVAILPRMFIGITAALTYAGLKRWNEYGALIIAAVVGTLTNTILVLGMVVIRGYLAADAALAIGILHGPVEAAVAAIVVVLVIVAWKQVDTGARSKVSDVRKA